VGVRFRFHLLFLASPLTFVFWLGCLAVVLHQKQICAIEFESQNSGRIFGERIYCPDKISVPKFFANQAAVVEFYRALRVCAAIEYVKRGANGERGCLKNDGVCSTNVKAVLTRAVEWATGVNIQNRRSQCLCYVLRD
jgi:hypothetical protein